MLTLSPPFWRRPKPLNSAYLPVERDPALPTALLMGDSISVAYTLAVRRLLAGRFNVERPLCSCGSSNKTRRKLDEWVGDGTWAVAHFNCGLHDLKATASGGPSYSLNEYAGNIDAIITGLQRVASHLIFATITPVPETAVRWSPSLVRAYNDAARHVCRVRGVAVNDLHAFSLPLLPIIQHPGDVHFSEDGAAVLAAAVSIAIARAAP